MVNNGLTTAITVTVFVFALLAVIFRKKIYRRFANPPKWFLAPLVVLIALVIFWPYFPTTLHDYIAGSLLLRVIIAVIAYGLLGFGVYLDTRSRRKANRKAS